MLILERLTFERANSRALKCFLYVVSSPISRRCECVEKNERCSRFEVLGLSHHAVACGCVSCLYSSTVAVLRLMVAPAVSAECRSLACDTCCMNRAMSRCSRRRNSEVSDHLGTVSIASVSGGTKAQVRKFLENDCRGLGKGRSLISWLKARDSSIIYTISQRRHVARLEVKVRQTT
jgi:hypothetical protein